MTGRRGRIGVLVGGVAIAGLAAGMGWQTPIANDIPAIPQPTPSAADTAAASSDADAQIVWESPQSESQPMIYRVCRVTAYCDRGLTAAGTLAGVGQCAAPEDIPFGTEVYIPELDRTFVVTDRTHKRFRQNTVDIFIPAKTDCLEFGRNYLECHFRLPATEWRRPSKPALLQVSDPPALAAKS